MTDKSTMKIEFAPGCFDSFDGTQEELDDMVAEIHRMFESGELEQNATLVDVEQLIDQDPELATVLFDRIENDNQRNLQ